MTRKLRINRNRSTFATSPRHCQSYNLYSIGALPCNEDDFVIETCDDENWSQVCRGYVHWCKPSVLRGVWNCMRSLLSTRNAIRRFLPAAQRLGHRKGRFGLVSCFLGLFISLLDDSYSWFFKIFQWFQLQKHWIFKKFQNSDEVQKLKKIPYFFLPYPIASVLLLVQELLGCGW